MQPSTQMLNVTSIRTDLGTQMRPRLDQNYIDELAEAKSEGVKLPPIEVFFDGQIYILFDGFHRFHADLKLEARQVECVVHQGGLRDALLMAAQVNEAHGLRRDRETKRRAVMTLLSDEQWRQWSDREIARQTLTSHTFVAELRKSLTPAPTGQVATLPPEPTASRKGGDGKTYPAQQKAKREFKEPSLDYLEQTASKPLSVGALESVVLDWAQSSVNAEDIDVLLQDYLDGDSKVVEELGDYLSKRRLMFAWSDVGEAISIVRQRIVGTKNLLDHGEQAPEKSSESGIGLVKVKSPIEGLETFEDFASVMFEEWLEETGRDLRNLSLENAYEFAFWLGCRSGSGGLDRGWGLEAGAVIAGLVTGLVDPPTVAPQLADIGEVANQIHNPAAKIKPKTLQRYIQDWYRLTEPNGSVEYWSGLLQEESSIDAIREYFLECGYQFTEEAFTVALSAEIEALGKRGAA